MKTTNYRLSSEMETISSSQTEWFASHVREILTSDKHFYSKTDYLGQCLIELQNKIDYLSEDIKAMQFLKRKLAESKQLAQQIIADEMMKLGVDRLDGVSISSLTITPEKTKHEQKISFKNPDALMKLGYFKVSLDEEAVREEMKTLEGMERIDPYIEMVSVTETVPAKIKVNQRRSNANNQAKELLNYIDEAA